MTEQTKPVTAQEALEALDSLKTYDTLDTVIFSNEYCEILQRFIEQNKQNGEAVAEVHRGQQFDRIDALVAYDGNLIHGQLLYTTPPTAQAYAALMLQKAASLIGGPHDSVLINKKNILSLITTDAQAALDDYAREIAMEVAITVFSKAAVMDLNHELRNTTGSQAIDLCRAIVNSVIEGKKG